MSRLGGTKRGDAEVPEENAEERPMKGLGSRRCFLLEMKKPGNCLPGFLFSKGD